MDSMTVFETVGESSNLSRSTKYAPVVKLVSTLILGISPKGCEFESHREYK